MTEGKCTFGTRNPIDIHMLNEIIYREVKHFRNYKIYRPNFASNPVSGKFYAYHDMVGMESEEEARKAKLYHENVSKMRSRGPRVKYPEPATENMRYGWHIEPLINLDRSDRRFYMPKQESKHTKVEVIIRKSNPKTGKVD